MRLWTLGDDGVGILSFKTKMNTVNDHVLDGIQHAVKLAEEKLKAVVIWQTGEPFSAGADLKGALGLLKEGKFDDFEKMVANFQRTSMTIKQSLVPVVSAVRGMAFGGGCEFQMHSARTVAALESYIGLVEAGVGLLPAGGGLHELAVRAAKANPADPFEELKKVFETVAMAKVATSALEAKNMGLLREDDVVVFNAYELLYVAKKVALAHGRKRLSPAAAGAQHPGRRRRRHRHLQGLAGQPAGRLLRLAARHRHRHPHRRHACAAARSSAVRRSTRNGCWRWSASTSSSWRKTEKTQARIEHTMTTGKPLRN